jgi:hypothetical protein
MGSPPDNELITAISNLTDTECKSLQASLQQNKIPFIVNEHGAHGKYQGYYFEIKVKKRDADVVGQIVSKFRAKKVIENRRCPKCGHSGYKQPDQVGWLTKMYYWGTTLVECKKCKTRFGI